MPSTPLVAIISKPQKPELAGILRELTGWLESHGYSYVLDPDSAAYVGGTNPVPREDLAEHDPNLVIVLGRADTLLADARVFAKRRTPILSGNLGSVGFLTEVPLPVTNSILHALC